MNKKEIFGAIALVAGIFAYSFAMFFAGQDYREKQLAQELCKYAEYDFCKVETYIIKIKKGK